MAFLKSVGTAFRRAGQSLEKLGLGMQGSLGYKETRECMQPFKLFVCMIILVILEQDVIPMLQLVRRH